MICVICHFDTELDDVVVGSSYGHCICLRCYHHQLETERPMPKALRREISAALDALPSA